MLNEGMYFLNAGVKGDVFGSEIFLSRLIDAAMFRVRPTTENFSTGIVDFDCNPKIELLELRQVQDLIENHS